MYKKILVPFDQSEPAKHALEQALDLTSATPDAEIVLLSVVDWHDFNAETFKIAARMSGVMGSALDMDAVTQIGEEAANEEKSRIKEATADIVGDRTVEMVVVNGSPHDAITAYAEEGNFDCIVMGHRGLGAVRSMLGSVCYSVLHKAQVPVLVVK